MQNTENHVVVAVVAKLIFIYLYLIRCNYFNNGGFRRVLRGLLVV